MIRREHNSTECNNSDIDYFFYGSNGPVRSRYGPDGATVRELGGSGEDTESHALGGTKRLARLEGELGVTLFQRTTRRVQATAEGEALCERARGILEAFQQAESELQERQHEPTGPLRVAATLGFGRRWLGPLVAEFQHHHPKVSVQLQLTERLPDLGTEGWDGAVWLWGVPPQRAGEWVMRRLARNERILVASPTYLLERGKPQSLQDLRTHRCLSVRENTSAPTHLHDQWQLTHRQTRAVTLCDAHGPLSSNSGELVRDWCLAGQGIMLRSVWDVSHHLAQGTLVHVLPDWHMPDADVHWIAPFRSPTPRRVRLLVDFLAERLATQRWIHGP